MPWKYDITASSGLEIDKPYFQVTSWKCHLSYPQSSLQFPDFLKNPLGLDPRKHTSKNLKEPNLRKVYQQNTPTQFP